MRAAIVVLGQLVLLLVAILAAWVAAGILTALTNGALRAVGLPPL